MQTNTRPLGVLSKPTFDAPVIVYLIAALLDTVTTLIFMLTGSGHETNQTLAALASISFIWVPVYLLCRPLLTAFLSDDLRLAYATAGAAICFPLSLNNLSGILFGDFFIYSLGMMDWIPVFAFILAGVVFACYHVIYRTPLRSAAKRVMLLMLWIALMEAVEYLFTLTARLAA